MSFLPAILCKTVSEPAVVSSRTVNTENVNKVKFYLIKFTLTIYITIYHRIYHGIHHIPYIMEYIMGWLN